MIFKILFNLIIVISLGVYKYIFPSSFFINILFFIYIFFTIYHLFILNGNKIFKAIIETCFTIGVTLFIISLGTIVMDIHNSKNSESKNEYIIVLGAGLRGDKPKNVLKYRLDKAIDYYKKYPNTIFIVSGGQGKDEIISESKAMKNYLVSHSVPKNNIIEENKSTTTLENLIFSHNLISNNVKNIGVISNDFHMYRVKFFANSLNYKINPIYAKTPLKSKVSLFSREALAIIYYSLKNILLIQKEPNKS